MELAVVGGSLRGDGEGGVGEGDLVYCVFWGGRGGGGGVGLLLVWVVGEEGAAVGFFYEGLGGGGAVLEVDLVDGGWGEVEDFVVCWGWHGEELGGALFWFLELGVIWCAVALGS